MEDVEELQLRVAELEELAELRASRIKELELELERATDALEDGTAATKPGGEVEELHAIIAAQEAAMEDQRRIIDTQSALIEDLNSHLKSSQTSQSALNPVRARTSSQGPVGAPPRRKTAGGAPSTAASSGSAGSGYASRNSSSLAKPTNARHGPAVGMSSGGAGAASSQVMRSGSTPRTKSGAVTERMGGSTGSFGSASSGAGGLGVRGPSPRLIGSNTPRTAASGQRSRLVSNVGTESAATAVQMTSSGGPSGPSTASSVATAAELPTALPLLSSPV
mmetsp:Transcript_96958/g.172579  ORF Transcript_96958/g.172579 Transcript_96958/m.172579 type:complete len:279 (-) Transcript_96958:68-904(-)